MNSDADTIIERVQAAWRDAFAARNFDALVQLYSTDALFFGSAPGLRTGRAAVRDYFLSLPATIALVDFPPMTARRLDVRTVIASGMWTFSRANERLLFRLSWSLQCVHDRWLIAQHHAGREPTAPL